MPISINPRITNILGNLNSVTPVQERMIQAVPSLALQPTIDLNNPDVDKDTQKTAAVKTAIMCVVGATDGIISRTVGMALGERLAINGKIKPISKDVAEIVSRDLAEKVPEISKTLPQESFLKHFWLQTKRLFTGSKMKETFFAEKVKQSVSDKTRNYISSVGNISSILAVLAGVVLIEIPVINKLLDFTMKKLFPNRNSK